MNMMTRLEPRSAPLSNDAARRSLRFRRLVSCFERDEIEAGVDALLAYLDARDGDTDLEPEHDRCAAGDDDLTGRIGEAMGFDCALGGDEDAEVAYTEWHTRGRHKLGIFGSEARKASKPALGPGWHGSEPREDDEDGGDLQDGTFAEDEALPSRARRLRYADGPGCIIADPDKGVDDDPHDPHTEDGI